MIKHRADLKIVFFKLYQNRETQSQSIQVDLNRWRLLASSGTHWIFCMKEEVSNSFSQENSHLYQNGDYVMRMKKSKQFEKIIKQRCEIIIQTLFKEPNNLNEQSLNQNIKQKKEKTNNGHKQVSGKDKDEKLLNGLIEKVYKQFLKVCLQGGKSSTKSKRQNNCILPKISDAIVRGSDNYYPSIPEKNQNSQPLTQFVSFIARELIYYYLLNNPSISRANSKIHQSISSFINEALQDHLQSHSFIIDQMLLIQCDLLNICVSFEKNQLISDIEKFSKFQKNQIFEVFQFKPKPIIPNIYTEKFIQHYLANYQQIQLTFGKLNAQKNQSQAFSTKTCDPSQIKSIIQSSLFDQGSFDKSDHNQLKIESTRWFKKNCLFDKKNRDNPLCFFSPCLNRKYKPLGKEERIDFFNKKHLKKRVAGSQKYNNIQTRTQKVYDCLIDYINNRESSSIHPNIVQNLENLSLLEEVLSLQLIDLADLFPIQTNRDSDSIASFNSQQRKETYFDILQTNSITQSLLRSLKHGNISDYNLVSDQKLYPSYIYSVIGTLFRPQVYEKAQKLSLLLKQLVFESKTISEAIINVFQLEIRSEQIIAKELTEIRQRLYYIIKFLLSLTWKDVSFMIQTLTSFDSLNKTCKNHENSQLKVIKCAIIDYGIKIVSNIYKNLQKQKEFLYNYETCINAKN